MRKPFYFVIFKIHREKAKVEFYDRKIKLFLIMR